MKTGEALIADERREQLLKHNWTAEHDDNYTDSELIRAAIAVLLLDENTKYHLQERWPSSVWPWNTDPWFWNIEKKDRIGQLAVAGALIAAEIDRIERQDYSKNKDDV